MLPISDDFQTHSAIIVALMAYISLICRGKTQKNKTRTTHPLYPDGTHPKPYMVHILSFTPPPGVTHEPLISIIINICLFNFQLCHNVST